MKVLHIEMTSPFTPNAKYQENCLIEEHAKQGHDVVMYATCYMWKDGNVEYAQETREKLDNGVTLERIKYDFILNDYVSRKIRKVKGFYLKLEKERPDLIMVHNGQTAIVPDICKYVLEHPNVKLIADSHTDPLNSATNWISKFFLHKLIYRRYMKMLYKHARTFYCISPEVRRYISELYGFTDDKLELLPLGGDVLSDKTYCSYRKEKRAELKLDDSIVHIVHSGKLTEEKHTADLLDAFSRLESNNVRLTIIGAAKGDVLRKIEDNEKMDSRISWLGWKSGDELIKYLCSGDIYVLPADVSATVQSAMCCRCIPVVYPYEIYLSMNLNDTCYAENADELRKNLQLFLGDSELALRAKDISFNYAVENLDYFAQAAMLLR